MTWSWRRRRWSIQPGHNFILNCTTRESLSVLGSQYGTKSLHPWWISWTSQKPRLQLFCLWRSRIPVWHCGLSEYWNPSLICRSSRFMFLSCNATEQSVPASHMLPTRALMFINPFWPDSMYLLTNLVPFVGLFLVPPDEKSYWCKLSNFAAVKIWRTLKLTQTAFFSWIETFFFHPGFRWNYLPLKYPIYCPPSHKVNGNLSLSKSTMILKQTSGENSENNQDV